MSSSKYAARSATAAIVFILLPVAVAQPGPLYLDPSQPVERRIADLLGRMTLEEKLGQINMPCVYVDQLGMDNAAKIESCRRFTEGTREKGIGPAERYSYGPDNLRVWKLAADGNLTRDGDRPWFGAYFFNESVNSLDD